MSAEFTAIVAMWFPGFVLCGSAIQPPRFPGVFGTVLAAMPSRLPK